jgi:hypothetical protein
MRQFHEMKCLERTLSVLVVPAFFAASCPAKAASTGYITEIVTNPNNGAVNFVVNGQRTDLPACANGQRLRWAIDGTNALAQPTIALLLAAHAQNQKVFVQGLGSCSSRDQPNVEAASYVALIP